MGISDSRLCTADLLVYWDCVLRTLVFRFHPVCECKRKYKWTFSNVDKEYVWPRSEYPVIVFVLVFVFVLLSLIVFVYNAGSLSAPKSDHKGDILTSCQCPTMPPLQNPNHPFLFYSLLYSLTTFFYSPRIQPILLYSTLFYSLFNQLNSTRSTGSGEKC